MKNHQDRFTTYYDSLLTLSDQELLAKLSSYEKQLHHFSNFLELKPSSKVLDIACGAGYIDILFAQRGYEVTALDINQKAMEVGRKLSSLTDSKVHWIHAPLEKFELDNKFDAILIWDVIFPMSINLDQNMAYLKRCKELLAAHGKILLEVYNKDYAIKHGIEGVFTYDKTNDVFIMSKDQEIKTTILSYEEMLSCANQLGMSLCRVGGWKSHDTYENRSILDPVDIFILSKE